MASPFKERVLSRLSRLDRDSLQGYVTGLFKEKREMEQVLDCVQEGLLLLSPQGIVQWSNHAAYGLLGFERVFPGRTRIAELIEDKLLQEFFEASAKQPEERSSDDFHLLSPRELFLRIHWIPLKAEGEQKVLVRIENLTAARGRLDEETRIQRIEILIRLAAGVAHEIGNPLNAIQIHIQLLKDEAAKLAERSRKVFLNLIEVISSETRRLDQIVRSFLRATRNPPLRFQLESVNDVLEEAAKFMQPEIQKEGVALKLILDRSLPSFFVDRDRLHQAFLNLIKNGAEAMPHGGKLLICSALKDKLCVLRFEDTGKGIPAEDLPHIFDAYYTTKREGSGLGLFQVYQAVRDHGGRMDVKSVPGKGTTFTLLLPLRKQRLSLPEPSGRGKGRLP